MQINGLNPDYRCIYMMYLHDNERTEKTSFNVYFWHYKNLGLRWKQMVAIRYLRLLRNLFSRYGDFWNLRPHLLYIFAYLHIVLTIFFLKSFWLFINPQCDFFFQLFMHVLRDLKNFLFAHHVFQFLSTCIFIAREMTYWKLTLYFNFFSWGIF